MVTMVNEVAKLQFLFPPVSFYPLFRSTFKFYELLQGVWHISDTEMKENVSSLARASVHQLLG